MTSRIGAAMPICEYGGVSATIAEPADIRRSVRVNAARRPTRSAYGPMIAAPSGQVTNPTPKVASAPSSRPISKSAGKERVADHHGEEGVDQEVVELGRQLPITTATMRLHREAWRLGAGVGGQKRRGRHARAAYLSLTARSQPVRSTSLVPRRR